MQKKYILATSAVIAVLVAGAITYSVCAQRNNNTAAIVNGETITMADVQKAYDSNPQFKQVPFEEFYAKAVDILINSKLVLQAATADNVQTSPEYQALLAEAQDELARQVYIEKQLTARLNNEEIQKFYDEYVANFKSEKEIKAKHILVETEEQAADIIAQLNSGKDTFDNLAKKYSKDNPDLGYFTAQMMVPEFSEAAAQIEKGKYSEKPVKTEFGYHVILVEDVRDSQPLPLAKVEEQIKINLSQKAMTDIVKELRDAANVDKFDINGEKVKEDASDSE